MPHRRGEKLTMAGRRGRGGSSSQSQNYYSSRDTYQHRRTERSRSPSWYDQRRRPRNIGDVGRPSDSKPSYYDHVSHQKRYWSDRKDRDHRHDYLRSSRSRLNYDLHEPSSGNFYNHDDDDDHDYGSSRGRSRNDDYIEQNQDDDYYKTKNSSSFHERRRPISHSKSYSSSKLSYHSSNREHRMNWSSKYSQFSRRLNLSHNFDEPQRWWGGNWSDKTPQRRRTPVNSRHYQHGYRKMRSHRPASPAGYSHRFSSRNSSSRPPKSSSYYNVSSPINSWGRRRTNCPIFPNYNTFTPDPGLIPNPGPPSPHRHRDFRNPCAPALSRSSYVSPSYGNLPSPCYNANTPRSLTPVFEHTPSNKSVDSDDDFIVSSPESPDFDWPYSPTDNSFIAPNPNFDPGTPTYSPSTCGMGSPSSPKSPAL